MHWITNKPAYSLGKPVPVGTKGEGDVPAHLVGKVSFLIVATPQEEPAQSEQKPKKGNQ